ncbi:hypothetical protein B0H16DRAFT_859970 [Mycena metata]|uniref:Uncharacterized protein n=1 Tax=Mycena metata TaxID=1033252 RepID=A0AAD7N7Q5_9AGAR|nr:hypothetical protein B0H16DRAFT_859970 [Mycena metata]
MSLTTTRSTLMHAVLAHVSPPLREFDLIAFGKLRLRPISHRRSLSSMPTEILLLIRSHMLPLLITHLVAISSTSLEHYETFLRELVCPQCAFYNEYVYGSDVWKWHPCSCAPSRPLHLRRPNPGLFRDRHHWLEAYLSRKSLRFRELSPPSSVSSTAIWDLASEVLGEFGCEATRRNPGRRSNSMALLSRWDRQSILIVPTPESRSAKELSSRTPAVLFRRLARDLGLSQDYDEPCRRLPAISTTRSIQLTASTHSPFDDGPSAFTVLLKILDAVTAPLAALLSISLSFVTLFFTVLCYYSKPGALRLF